MVIVLGNLIPRPYLKGEGLVTFGQLEISCQKTININEVQRISQMSPDPKIWAREYYMDNHRIVKNRAGYLYMHALISNYELNMVAVCSC